MVVLKDNMFSEAVEAHTRVDNAPITVPSTAHELGSEAVKILGAKTLEMVNVVNMVPNTPRPQNHSTSPGA